MFDVAAIHTVMESGNEKHPEVQWCKYTGIQSEHISGQWDLLYTYWKTAIMYLYVSVSTFQSQVKVVRPAGQGHNYKRPLSHRHIISILFEAVLW